MTTAPLAAHEFWIDLSHGIASPGQEISANLRVGQDLKGNAFPYLTDRFTDFVLVHDQSVWPVVGRDGDKPAATILATDAGLYIIAQRSVPFLTTYKDADTFAQFLEEEGLSSYLQSHRARGLPESGFTERYRRHAKALFQVGPVEAGQVDRLLGGLELELVAETNPFVDGTEEVSLRLYQNETPLAEHQVALFHQAQSVVTRSTYVTDTAGRIAADLSGPGEYLFNSVTLHPRDEGDVVWQSEWASLFFRLE